MKISDSTQRVLASITGAEKIPISPDGHVTITELIAKAKLSILPFDLILFKLTQIGTGNPVYNEIYNPASISSTVVRSNMGFYTMQLPFSLDNNKVMVGNMNNLYENGVLNFDKIGIRISSGGTHIIIETASLSTGNLADDILEDSGFFIIIFP